MTDHCLSLLCATEGLLIKRDEPLASRSSFSIGGPAAFALFPQTDKAFTDTLILLCEEEEPFLLVGNATNLLFDDSGYAGTVLFTTALKTVSFEGTLATCSAGASLFSLCASAKEKGLGGLSFAAGIPGTVGGAVKMNAGAFGGEIADVFLFARVFDPEKREVRLLTKEEAAFGYRSSVFQVSSLILLSATFSLYEEDPDVIAEQMQKYAEKRRLSQPLSHPSAGSVFRRPKGYFAGKLIEEAGLLGYRIGGAEVSKKHGGFIINRGGATSADVLMLIEHIRKTVYARSGVLLEPEIIYIPNPNNQII